MMTILQWKIAEEENAKDEILEEEDVGEDSDDEQIERNERQV